MPNLVALALRLALPALVALTSPSSAMGCEAGLLSRVAAHIAYVYERAAGYKRDFSWTEKLPAPMAIEALLPIARGVQVHDPLDIYQANRLIRDLAKTTGGYPARSESAMPRSDRDMLLFEPVVSVEVLGGGWNESYLVRFRNNRYGVFKPFLGQKNMGADRAAWADRVAFVREVTAVPLIEDYLKNRESREAGLSRVSIPETVETILVHGRKSYGLGSMQLFVAGHENAAVRMERSEAEWKKLTGSPQWREMEARVRVLDYILGNPDRFSNPGLVIPQYAASNYNNLMLPLGMRTGEDLQALLIDTAFGRPGLPDFSLRFVPEAALIPRDLKKAVMDFDEIKFRSEFVGRLPKAGIDDVISRVRQVRRHIFGL